MKEFEEKTCLTELDARVILHDMDNGVITVNNKGLKYFSDRVAPTLLTEFEKTRRHAVWRAVFIGGWELKRCN